MIQNAAEASMHMGAIAGGPNIAGCVEARMLQQRPRRRCGASLCSGGTKGGKTSLPAKLQPLFPSVIDLEIGRFLCWSLWWLGQLDAPGLGYWPARCCLVLVCVVFGYDALW